MQAEQEVELIDYLNVIWKRKGLIVGGALLAAATALVVSLSMPKTYEVSRTLKIGMLPGGIIESREAVIGRLRDHRFLKNARKKAYLGMTLKEIADDVSIDRKINPHVRYKVRAPDPQFATRLADTLAETIITTHKKTFDRAIQIGQHYETELTVAIRNAEAATRDVKTTLQKIMEASEVDTQAVILLQANVNERERNLGDLRRELKDSRLSRLRYENTSVIAVDAPPKHPSKPNVKLNVALASTVGLMVFTFLAFFLEYIERAKRRED